jgi:hypothetical protein
MKDKEFADGNWLNSDNFLKRAFAIYGYVIVAHFLVMAGIFVVAFILGALSG